MQALQEGREGARVKRNVNIQVNGTVNGGIHVYGRHASVGSAPLAKHTPAAFSHTSARSNAQLQDALWALIKVLAGALAVVPVLVVIVGLALALCSLVLFLVAVAIGWGIVCACASGVLFVQERIGGPGAVLQLVPSLFREVRALATGERVNEIESTEMTRYVD